MGKGELDVGLQELTDVRPLDVVLLLKLGNSEDLFQTRYPSVPAALSDCKR